MEESRTKDRRISFSDWSICGLCFVFVDPFLFFIGNICVGENGFYGALRNASATIDAFVRVDDEVGIHFAECFYWAYCNAILVLVVYAC
tara:strand:+ start:148 stop:414 length:267 start_codon:yes stop_codon:yes gene_type:complete